MRKQFGMLVATACLAATVAVALPVQVATAAPAQPTSLPPAEGVVPPISGGAGYAPLVPSRIADTRADQQLGAGQTLDVSVLGVGGVPASGVDAVVLNVTVTRPSVAGWMTVFPSGGARPLASSLNFAGGQTVANVVVAKVGANGKVSIYNAYGSVHVVVDVQGWFAAGSGYSSLVPARLTDTRDADPLGEAQMLDVSVLGVGGVPASGVDAVVLNVTVTRPSVAGWMTVFPSGGARPTASNVNFAAGQTVANLVIAKVGANGKVSIYNATGDAHVIVDVQGWFAAGAGYTPLVPARIADTRDSDTPVAEAGTLDVSVLGVGGVPVSGVDAVVLNVTVTQPSVGGWMTAFPAGEPRPLASNLNFVGGQKVANLVIAKVGANGKVSLYNAFGQAHVVVDVQGWFGSGNDVFHGVDSAWSFVPGSLAVAPGESRIVQLVQTDSQGRTTGSSLPAGVTFDTTGPDGQLTVVSLGGTRVRVTAADVIDTVVVGARIPGWDIGPSLDVTIARFRPETVQLKDDQIVFPQTDLPPGADATNSLPPGVTLDSVGPFTWDEYRARTNLPEDGMAGITDPQSAFEANYWYPVVLVGDAPPVGSVVYGVEGNVIAGRVIEPPGLPTLQRDGQSLVAVAIVGPQEAFLDLKIDIDYEDLSALGVVEPPFHYDSAEELATNPTGGPSRTAHSTGLAGQSLGAWVRSCRDSLLAESGASASAIEISPILALDVRPVTEAQTLVHDGDFVDMRMKAGVVASLTIGFKVKLQLQLNFEAACIPHKFATAEQPLPGYFRAVASFVYEAGVAVKLGLKMVGGPQVTLGVSCAIAGEMSGGFTYSAATDFVTLQSPEPTKTCSTDNGGSWVVVGSGANNDGVAVQIEPSFSVLPTITGGLRIGGQISKIIGDFVDIVYNTATNLGIVSVLKFEAGPVVKVVWENAVNAVTNQDAKSGIFANLEGKAVIELKSFYFLFSKFTVKAGSSEASMEIPLFAFAYQLGAIFPPLKNTRFEVKINGDDASTSPAIYVQKDDVLKLLSVTAPTATAVNGPSQQLTEGWLYRKSGNTWDRVSDFGAVTAVASTGAEAAWGKTSLQFQVTISETLCDRLKTDPKEYALIGNAPVKILDYSIPMPAWGGSFKIQCVEGKVKWDPVELLDLKPDQTREVSIVTSGARDDTLKFTGVPAWLKFDSSDVDVPKNVIGDTTVTRTIEIKSDGSSPACQQREAIITVSTTHRGKSEFKVRENEKCYVRFTPVNVTGPGEVLADLHTEGFRDMYVQIDLMQAQAPSWLHLLLPLPNSPQGNPHELRVLPSNGQEQVIPFKIKVDEREPKCVDQPARAHIIELNDPDRGHTVLTVRDPKVDKRVDCGFTFTPDELYGHGVSQLHLFDDRLTPATEVGWSIAPTSVPNWLTVAPMEGTMHNDGNTNVLFGGEPPTDPCIGRGEVNLSIFAVATLPDNASLDARIVLHWPAVPKRNDCASGTGHSDADPHMVSMDGARWENQTLGEYVYTRSLPGSPNNFRLVVRQQPSNPEFADQSKAPASVTGVALEIDGRLAEVVLDDDRAGYQVYLDGYTADLADGVPVAVGPSLTVVRTGDTVRFDAPGLTVTSAISGWIDLSLTMSQGLPVEGLMGTVDQNWRNDFVGSDGTEYVPEDIIDGVIPEFENFVASWRVTDQSDSPFTVQLSPSRFSKPNPAYDPAIMAEWGAQADAVIATMSTVCDTGSTLTVRTRYSIAVELSIGTPLATLEDFLCHYGVQGVATVDGQPVPGLTVTVDGHGLKPCVTTTGADGGYLCIVAPDSAEAAGSPPSLPLQLDVTGTWPGQAGTVATATASFPALASTTGGPQMTTADLAVNASSVPVLDVSGVISRDGEPLGGDHQFMVEAYDQLGVRVGLFSVTASVDAATGAYSFHRALPGTAASAHLVTYIEWPVFETFTQDISGLTNGPNPTTFDAAYTVPTLTVSGTASTGSAGVPSPVTIQVHATTATGDLLPAQTASATVDPATGAYVTTIALPRRAANAVATMLVPPLNQSYSTAVVSIVPGPNAVTLDVVHNPPVVLVHGTLLDEHGAPLSGFYTLETSFYDASGARVTFSSVGIEADAAGAYELVRYGAVGAVTMETAIVVGVAGERFSSGIVPVTPGLNSLELNATLAPVHVTVSGTFVDAAGDAVPGPVLMFAQFFDAASGSLGFQSQYVTVAVDGSYSAEFTGNRAATTVRLLAGIGVATEQYRQELAVSSGDNPVTFNVVHHPPVVTVSGTMVNGLTGEALAGPIAIDVEFRDGTTLLGTEHALAQPAAPDGAYTVSVPGHHSATSAHVIARVGQNGETVTGDVPSLVPGPNPLTLNVGFTAPVVTFAGTMLRTGGGPLAANAYVNLLAVDSDGAPVYTEHALVTIGANGAYSLTRTLPQRAVSVTATVEASSFAADWKTTGVVPVVPGNQTVPFNVLLQPVLVQVSGTMTKAPGQEMTGPVVVGVSAIDAGGAQVAYGQRAVMPDAGTGAYSFTFTFPEVTDHVDVTGFVGSYSFEQRHLTAPVTPGVTTPVAFDIVHAPPTVHVSGVASVNGVLNSGLISVNVLSTVTGQPGPVPSQQFPQAVNGVYAADLVLPDGTTSYVVQVKALDGANTYTSTQTGVLPNEARSVAIDFDDTPSVLTISGTLRMFGLPAGFGNLVVQPKDAGDVVLDDRTIYLSLAGDGSYSIDVPLPNGTDHVTVVATAGAGLYETLSETVELVGVGSGTSSRTIDLDSTMLQLNGTLLDGGVPVAGTDGTITLSTSGTHNGQPVTYTSTADYETIYTEGTGAFHYQQIVPGDLTDATVSIVGVANPAPTYQFTGLAPGTYTDTWDVDIAGTTLRQFTVNGTMLYDGGPWSVGDMDVVITPYALDGSNANVSPPWTDLGAITVTLHVDDVLGTWSWSGELPVNTTVVNVEVKPFGNTFGYQQAWVLPAAGPVVETFTRDFGAAQVTFSDRLLPGPSCAASTLMVTYQVYAFAAEPADKTGDPSTWAGAHVMDPISAIPHLSDDIALTTVQMPADTTYFFVVISPASVYTAGPWIASIAWGTTIPLGGNVGFGNNFTFGCA